MTYDVFISYKSEYVDIVKAISHTLEAEGIRCWYATRDLERNFAGKNYSDAINNIINSVNIVICIVNDELLNSDWCRSEIDMALDLGKIVIPYSINKITVSNGLTMRMRGRHWIDAYPNPERKFSLLVNNVKSNLNILSSDQKTLTFYHYVQEDDSDFDYEEGEMLYDAKEYNDAILALSVSAEKGNSNASLLISKIFYHLPETYEVSDDVWNVMDSQSKQKFSHANFALHTKYYRDQENFLISYEYVKKATLEKKNHYAYLRLGIHYGWGIGVKPNHVLAKMWYEKAIDAGSVEAYAYLGQEYESGSDKVAKNTEKAFELYKKGVEGGDLRAIRRLGNCYQEGIGVGKNQEKAIECYNQMVELENYSGYSDIGLLHHRNEDIDKAKEFYKKAARHNVGDAFASLAGVYWSEGNVNEAVKWANAGFQVKNGYATRLLAWFYENGDSDNKLEANIEKAWDLYFTVYSWTGAPADSVSLAKIYFEKHKPENVDIEYILKILDTASRNLDKDAIDLLIDIYSGNKGIPSNDKKLLEYTLLGAEANIEEFMLKAADLYEQGTGVVQNSFKAMDWLEKAGHLGNTTAITRLIKMCKKDSDNLSLELKQWIMKAAGYGMTDYYQEAAGYLEVTEPEQAFGYIKMLSEKQAMAMATLSRYYAQGIGTEVSPTLSLEYKNKALATSSLSERGKIARECAEIKDTQRIYQIEQFGIVSEDDKKVYFDNFYTPLLLEEEAKEFASIHNIANQHFKKHIATAWCKELISALNDIYKAHHNLCKINNLKITELNNVTKSDFKGIPAYEITHKVIEDTCRIFLNLKTNGLLKDYSFRLSADEFLDICETDTHEGLQSLAISLIEVQIEIADFDKALFDIFLQYKNKDYEKLAEKLNSLTATSNSEILIKKKKLETLLENEKRRQNPSLLAEETNSKEDYDFERLLQEFIDSEKNDDW